MSDRVEIQIPFAGFYETHHDMQCDDAVEGAFNYNHETDEDQDLPGCFWDADIDWSAIRIEYVKNYVKAFADRFELDLEFAEMTSPREYNFVTDRIFVSIPREQIDKIKNQVLAREDGRKYVSDRFTSGPGFSSFYSNDLNDEEWTRDTLDECQYGVIMQFYVDIIDHDGNPGEDNWYDREWDLVQDFELGCWDSVQDAQAAVDKAIEAANVSV